MNEINKVELLDKIKVLHSANIVDFNCSGIRCDNCIFNTKHKCGGKNEYFNFKRLSRELDSNTFSEKESINIKDVYEFKTELNPFTLDDYLTNHEKDALNK